MKSKILVISAILVCSMFLLSMNALAQTMTLSAWTGKSSYDYPTEDVDIYAEWSVSGGFSHTRCNVTMDVRHKFSTWVDHYTAYYIPGSGGGGDFDVYCGGDSGDAYFEWPSGNGWESTFFVEVTVVAYPGPVDDWAWTNDFVLY